MAQLTEEQKLAALLAGSISKELKDSAGNKAHRIDPNRFIYDMGVHNNPSVGATSMPPLTKIPGMVEEIKTTPAEPEITGMPSEMPDLIPIPDDLKKYVDQETPIKEEEQPVPIAPLPSPNPDQQIITEPAPVPIQLTPENILGLKILAHLKRIDARLGIENTDPAIDNILKPSEIVLLNENNTIKRHKRSKPRTKKKPNRRILLPKPTTGIG